MRGNVSGRKGKIQEELERKIRLKIESILDEVDEENREEMILGLEDEELGTFNEAQDEMDEGEYDKKPEGISTLFEMANLQKDESVSLMYGLIHPKKIELP